MRYDHVLVFLMGVFFIVFSFIIRFVINEIIRKSDKRTTENKEKEIKKGKIISVLMLLMALYWFALFFMYDKLF